MATLLDLVNQRLRIGNVDVANRIFFAAHSTNFAERLSSERLARYYAARARAGVGLIIHEPVVIHRSSLSRPTKVWGFDPENVPHYQRAARAVHEGGAAFFCNCCTTAPTWAACSPPGPCGPPRR